MSYKIRNIIVIILSLVLIFLLSYNINEYKPNYPVLKLTRQKRQTENLEELGRYQLVPHKVNKMKRKQQQPLSKASSGEEIKSRSQLSWQMQLAFNQWVTGSNPVGRTLKYRYGEMVSCRSPKALFRVRVLIPVQKMLLQFNGLELQITDLVISVRVASRVQNGQFGRGGRHDCKSCGVSSILTLTSQK